MLPSRSITCCTRRRGRFSHPPRATVRIARSADGKGPPKTAQTPRRGLHGVARSRWLAVLRRECGGPAVLPVLDRAIAESDPHRTIGGAGEPVQSTRRLSGRVRRAVEAAVGVTEHLRARGHEHAARRARADGVASADGGSARRFHARETPVRIAQNPLDVAIQRSPDESFRCA